MDRKDKKKQNRLKIGMEMENIYISDNESLIIIIIFSYIIYNIFINTR